MTLDLSAFRFGFTAFVTLLVVIDPPGLVPIFVGLTESSPPIEQKRVLNSSVLTAFMIALFFLLAGRLLLTYLGVSINAFSISGGILLFLVALPMLFGERGGLQSSKEGDAGGESVDIAIFPIAIPLITGPGTLTTLLILAAQAKGNITREIGVLVAVLLVFLATWLTLSLGVPLLRKLGKGGIHVFTRVLGLILAALAVQFVLNGLGELGSKTLVSFPKARCFMNLLLNFGGKDCIQYSETMRSFWPHRFSISWNGSISSRLFRGTR